MEADIFCCFFVEDTEDLFCFCAVDCLPLPFFLYAVILIAYGVDSN